MYPFLRFAKAIRPLRSKTPLSPGALYRSDHICWPWDIDPFLELNNGRALTLYDLGRFGFARQTGLLEVIKRERWGLTIAGSSVRYRARMRAFQRFEMRTRMLGWDARFMYLEQSMWRGTLCCSHLLIRVAFTDPQGIVPMARVAQAYGVPSQSAELPEWVNAWIDAEAQRPWPPMLDTAVQGAESRVA